jgi:hypothetical protein
MWRVLLKRWQNHQAHYPQQVAVVHCQTYHPSATSEEALALTAAALPPASSTSTGLRAYRHHQVKTGGAGQPT